MIKQRKWLICNPIPNSYSSCNKDLNGGYGTWDKIGDNIISKIIGKAKKNNIKIPVLCLGYIHTILIKKGFDCIYSENYKESLIISKKESYEGVIIYGSIVCCELENKLIYELKKINSHTKIFVVGTFPSKFPNRFEKADFVIIGEPEEFFINWDCDINSLEKKGKKIFSENLANLDLLPFPTYSKIYADKFSYSPMLPKPTGFIEATRGCPYSCGYYCTYGENQGKLIRGHSPKKLVEIMKESIKKYGFKSFQFRDPVFGLKKDFIDEFCLNIMKSGLEIKWGMETRLDLLTKSSLLLMKKAGLSSINIGIETPNFEIAKSNKRSLYPEDKQKDLIDFATNLKIKINAFYIIGFEEDTLESCNETIEYSLRLNTFMARFAVCTPYPGTEYFEELDKNNRIKSKGLSTFNQLELVYRHKNLNEAEIKRLVQKAYFKYYFRPKIISKILNNKFRNY